MRRLLSTVSLLAATAAFLGCSGVPSASAPTSTPTPSPSATASNKGGDGATKAAGGEAGEKATRTAADCPSVGEAVAPPGPPSVGKARHEEIVATFQKHRDKFRCCYDTARQQNPSLKGSYHVEIVLKSDGSIKQVFPKKEASEIHDQGMDDCVFTVAKVLQFSPNAEGKETTIPYPFNFTPGGGR